MPYTIPSTADLVARNKSNIESHLNQTTPPADKAFNTVLAVEQGMSHRGLYAYAADRVNANFAMTAQGDDLDAIGEEYDILRGKATAAVIVAALPADDGTSIDLSTIFVGPQGLQYETQNTVVAPSGAPGSGVIISMVCKEPGVSGNLSVGDILTIEQPVSGAGRLASVSSVSIIGTEKEEDDDYRIKILDAERAEGGGGNSSDIRSWGESIAGVKRIYPFTGKPWDSGVTEYPGMRTVYVEATENVDPSGVAPSGLLASVKAAILADPNTGEVREILGLTTDTLFVKSIYRTPLYLKIVGLSVSTGTVAAAQTAVESAMATYMKIFGPFVQGLDPDFDRLDQVTASLLAREIQDLLDSYGGTCQNVLFGTSVGTFIGIYLLGNAEKLSLGGIVWASA